MLDVLSGEKPETLYDCAGFVQVLDKVERVGARAYGLEGEAESASRCVINLAVLNGTGLSISEGAGDSGNP